jgi:hypothetical protein
MSTRCESRPQALARLIATLLVAWLTGGMRPSAQQPQPVIVRISPASSEVEAGAAIDVTVDVVDVDGLYAFDVQLTYDPSALEVLDANADQDGIQVAQGRFLDPGLTIYNFADNTAGTVHFLMTQLNPSLPKSGSGALMVVRMEGKRAGAVSAITLERADLARNDGTSIETIRESGEVKVVADTGQPTYTPVPIQVPGTALPAPTPTVTGSPATATRAPSGAPQTPSPTPGMPTATPFPKATGPAPLAIATSNGTEVVSAPTGVVPTTALPLVTTSPAPPPATARVMNTLTEAATDTPDAQALVPTVESAPTPIPVARSLAPTLFLWLALAALALAAAAGVAALVVWLRRRRTDGE